MKLLTWFLRTACESLNHSYTTTTLSKSAKQMLAKNLVIEKDFLTLYYFTLEMFS